MNNNNNNQNTTNVQVASLEEDLQATTNIIGGDIVDSNIETAMGDATQTEKAVLTFVDERPNLIVGKTTQLSNSYSQAGDIRADIAAYLSRPIHIRSEIWNIDNHLDFTFRPWEDFVNNTSVAKKLANFQLARYSLNVRFVINGTRFHYGLGMISYNPYHLRERGAKPIGNIPRELALVTESQRPRGFLNPMKNDTLEMKLPFFNLDNWFSIAPLQAFKASLGEITFRSMTELRAVSATASTSVEIQVFVYATDVELSMPTAQMKRSTKQQTGGKNISVNKPTNKTNVKKVSDNGNDEHQKDGMISAPATAIANLAKGLVNVPVLGTYAKATEIGANAVSNIAKMFGFSKPTIVTDMTFMRPTPFTNFATVNGGDSVMKLSFDVKQETTISNDIGGIKNVKDEMSIGHIVGTESFVGTLAWSDVSVFGDQLCTINVSPCIVQQELTIGYTTVAPTSLTFGSIPFRYWSGTIIYRFQIVASQFHTGRFRLVYEPNGAYPVTTDFNNAFSVVMDLQESSDFEVAISWAQHDPYRDVQDLRVPSFAMDSSLVTYDDRIHNGRLTMTILNALKSPESGKDVYINVYARAGPDFDVFCPTDKDESLTYSHQKVSYGDIELVAGAAARNLEIVKEHNDGLPKAQMMSSTECQDPDMPDDFVKEIQLVGESDVDVLREKHLIFSGEHINSFRALVKRYAPTDVMSRYAAAPQLHSSYTFMRNTFPMTTGLLHDYYFIDALGNPYNAAPTSLLAYLRGGYVGYRGGLRYKYVSMYSNTTQTITASRKSDNQGRLTPITWSRLVPGNSTDNSIINSEFFQNTSETGGWQGTSATTADVNNTLEVEYPYYNKYRFITATNQDLPLGLASDGSSSQLSIVGVWNGGQSSNKFLVMAMVAAAEDFNFLWYIGAPLMFVDPL